MIPLFWPFSVLNGRFGVFATGGFAHRLHVRYRSDLGVRGIVLSRHSGWHYIPFHQAFSRLKQREEFEIKLFQMLFQPFLFFPFALLHLPSPTIFILVRQLLLLFEMQDIRLILLLLLQAFYGLRYNCFFTVFFSQVAFCGCDIYLSFVGYFFFFD